MEGTTQASADNAKDLKEEEGEEEVEMTFEEFLIYSARIGELEDVKLSIDDKVDVNTVDKSGTGALRNKTLICL